MTYPAPTPCSEKLPPRRKDGAPRSEDVLIFYGDNGWQRASYEYHDEADAEGVWNLWGITIPAGDVSHWLPLPPNPLKL